MAPIATHGSAHGVNGSHRRRPVLRVRVRRRQRLVVHDVVGGGEELVAGFVGGPGQRHVVLERAEATTGTPNLHASLTTSVPPSTRSDSPLTWAASSLARKAMAAATVSGPRGWSIAMHALDEPGVDALGEHEVAGDRRVDRAGAHAVRPDAVAGVLDGEHLREREHAALRRRVGRRPRVAGERRGRRGVDDGAAARVEQRRDGGLAGEERAGEVDGEHLVPRVERVLVGAGRAQDAGDVGQDVQRAVASTALADGPLGGGGVADVADDVDARRRRRGRSTACTSTATTVAPSATRRSTVARPMPDAAPVTIAVRPSKRCTAAKVEHVLVPVRTSARSAGYGRRDDRRPAAAARLDPPPPPAPPTAAAAAPPPPTSPPALPAPPPDAAGRRRRRRRRPPATSPAHPARPGAPLPPPPGTPGYGYGYTPYGGGQAKSLGGISTAL